MMKIIFAKSNILNERDRSLFLICKYSDLMRSFDKCRSIQASMISIILGIRQRLHYLCMTVSSGIRTFIHMSCGIVGNVTASPLESNQELHCTYVRAIHNTIRAACICAARSRITACIYQLGCTCTIRAVHSPAPSYDMAHKRHKH